MGQVGPCARCSTPAGTPIPRVLRLGSVRLPARLVHFGELSAKPCHLGPDVCNVGCAVLLISTHVSARRTDKYRPTNSQCCSVQQLLLLLSNGWTCSLQTGRPNPPIGVDQPGTKLLRHLLCSPDVCLPADVPLSQPITSHPHQSGRSDRARHAAFLGLQCPGVAESSHLTHNVRPLRHLMAMCRALDRKAWRAPPRRFP
ncbi:MAG: hypothetical protein AMJ93_07610 [Anaerolineae bacterium SM23_84]|nr:MAG: hypothetical protein AMJ93_07610 [Anaerolineae bacterium SM23_84]